MGLADQLDVDPYEAEAWVPKEPGEKLIGHITGFGRRITEYQPDGYLILQVKDAAGKAWAVHAFHYVLAEELRKYKLKVGAEIGFKFLGKPEGKNYVSYRVVSDAEIIMPGEADTAYEPAPDVSADTSGFQTTAAASSPVDDDIPF